MKIVLIFGENEAYIADLINDKTGLHFILEPLFY